MLQLYLDVIGETFSHMGTQSEIISYFEAAISLVIEDVDIFEHFSFNFLSEFIYFHMVLTRYFTNYGYLILIVATLRPIVAYHSPHSFKSYVSNKSVFYQGISCLLKLILLIFIRLCMVFLFVRSWLCSFHQCVN